MNETIIRVTGLTTRFGDEVVLEGLDLEVRRGEVMGVVGASGSGKSVLLKTIVGLLRPAAGRIEVLGQEPAALDSSRRRALEEHWGVLFQDGALFSSLTVAQNVAVPLQEHTDLSPALIAEIAAVKLDIVGLSPEDANKMPSQLSGGMRKRAGLARALALDPEILFLDEPTSGLDPIAAGAFDELIRELQRNLCLTVFMVTHDLDSLTAICDRIAVLVDKKVLIGTLDELLRNSHLWIQSFFHGPRGRAALHTR